jgi:two-component system, cell cycle sensor histidine kinase and response regulator CckA
MRSSTNVLKRRWTIFSVRFFPFHRRTSHDPARRHWRRVELRQWWLSATSMLISLVLTLGLVSFLLSAIVPGLHLYEDIDPSLAVQSLIGLVLLFDLYVLFQQVQISRFRRQTAEREELFSLIGESAEDMIAVVDVNGRRLYNSPSYQRLLGYSAEELESTSSLEQIHPDDRQKVVQAAQEAHQSGFGRRVEYRFRHKDGRWLTLESTASVARDVDGEVQKLVIVNRDITERKQLEVQLSLSQQLEAIGRLSGGVAHDFNNLLGVIIGYSEALQQRLSPDDPNREAIDEIRNAGERAASLTQQLLAFSRKQVLELKVLDLNTIVADVEKILSRLIGEDIGLRLALSPQPAMVKADRSQIEQVLLNLAVNARDAMPQGGALIIETADVAYDQSSPRQRPYLVPGQYVLLKVTDTGCGMDAALQSRIFEPFFTTKGKGKGTGLGLATVYGVIKQSGGYILVESEVGRGTTFEVYLPSVAEAVESPVEARRPARPGHDRAILLVEDEHSLRKLTLRTLREIGYTVLEAQDARQALEIAAPEEIVIDLLLTDVVMPGMSGPALAGALCARRPEVRVLYMSGYTDGEIAPHGVLEAGTAILRKPFTCEQLVHCVEEALGAVTAEMEA